MNWPFGLLGRSKYGVIYADPAWKFKGYAKSGVPQRADQQHYKTMTVEEMAKLPVAHLAAPDCALLMWTTSSHLPQALKLGAAWGFKYSSKAFSWAKLNKHAQSKVDDQVINGLASVPICPTEFDPDTDRIDLSDDINWFMGMGYTTRRNTEDCYLFTRGKPKVLDHGVRELIVAPIREHSRKPDEAIERIERLYGGPYCELFGRTQRGGWSSWGNEVNKF